MSMRITVDPNNLSKEQREAVAGFILAYPFKGQCLDEGCPNAHTSHICVSGTAGKIRVGDTVTGHPDGELKIVGVSAVNGDQIAEAMPNELEVLQHDHESTMPQAAFGQVSEAAAAFGVPPAPLPLGATAAPSTAVAAPLPTAPVVPPVTTSTVTSTAPVPPAPMPASVAPPAAPPTGSPVHAGSHDGMSAALMADAQNLAAMGQSGAAVLPNGVELDKHGLPWDGRIHAGTKRKNADGSWTAKRGVDPTLVAAVEAELRQVMGAPAAPLTSAGAPIATTPATYTHQQENGAGAVPAPMAPPPPVAGATPITQVAPNAAPNVDPRAQFVALVGRTAAAIQAQKVSQAEVTQICTDSGIPALPLLANRLDLVDTVATRIDALIAARSQ